jgi:integrase
MPKLSSTRLTKRLVEAAKPGQCLSDCDVRGFRVVVSPSGARRFVAHYRLPNGNQSTVKLGTFPALTVEEAREAAREQLALVRKGIDPGKRKRELREAPTLSDLAQQYLVDYATARDLRAATIRNARNLLAKVPGPMMRRKVQEVTTAELRKLHGDVRAAGVEAGAKGVYQANRLLATLSKMFSLAIELEWRTDNPCKGVRKFGEDQRWRNLADCEVIRLLTACEAYEAEHDDAMAYDAADAIRLLLFTGARRQEVLAAEWGQFDLQAGIWEKPSAHTKTRKQHRLELDGPALDLLRAMRARASHGRFLFPGHPKRVGRVFDMAGNPIATKPRADLKKPWAWVVDRAALADVRLHDLRRTTASFMISGGASLATVGKALGHTQASTTARYAHLSQTVQREELKRAGERMVGLWQAGKSLETLASAG